MEPEEYYKKYFVKSQEMGIYLSTYVEAKIGELNDFSESSVEEYNTIANRLLDELVKENEQEIHILIKQ